MKLINQWRDSGFHYLFGLYCIANFFLLINYSGVYWDDWTLVNQDPATILNAFAQSGFWWMGYFHVFLQSIGNGIYIYRLISFFSYFFSGILLYYILKRLNYFSKKTLFFLILLFLIAPINDARVALINTPSILTLCQFYFAFFLLSIYLDSDKKIYIRLLILSLFFISFCLESLLVFYAIVLCYILIKVYQQNQNEEILSLLKIFLTQYLDFICLPFIFFGFKHVFLQPYGLYAGYNSLHFNFLNLIHMIAQSFSTSLYAPILQALNSLGKFWVTPIILGVVIYTLGRARGSFPDQTSPPQQSSNITIKTMLIPGVVLFLVAVFPYCAVGKLPDLNNWASRNQVLVPLSMAFLVYYLVLQSAVIHKKVPVILLNLLITSFIVQTLYSHYLYDLDWFYQRSLLAQFKQSQVFQKNTTFIAKDNLEMDIWVHNRGLDFYEVNGLLKKAFNEDTRLLVHDITAIDLFARYKVYPQYNFSHWVKNTPVYIELSKNDGFPLTPSRQFWLFYDSVFNIDTFENSIRNLTKIQYLTPSEVASKEEKLN